MASLTSHLNNTFEDEWASVKAAQQWVYKIGAQLHEQPQTRNRDELMLLRLALAGAEDWLKEAQLKLGRSIANMGQHLELMDDEQPTRNDS